MTMSPNAEMIKGFIEEVKSYIPSLMQGIETLKEKPDRKDVFDEIYRMAHTIKGASSMVGVSGLSLIASQMEDALDDVISGKLELNEKAFMVMSDTIAIFTEYCERLFDGGVNSRVMLKETVTAFRRLQGLSSDEDEDVMKELLESVPECEEFTFPANIDPKTQSGNDRQTGKDEPTSAGGYHETLNVHQKSPFENETEEPEIPLEDLEKIKAQNRQIKKKFQPSPELMEGFYEEAEEHIEDLGRSLNVLESQIRETATISVPQREEIRQIRRSVHTLKGASSIVGLNNISDWAHNLEDFLDWLYEIANEISPEIVLLMAESIDLLEGIVKNHEKPYESKADAIKEKYSKIMGPVREVQRLNSEDMPSDAFSESLPETEIDMEEILDTSLGISTGDDKGEAFEEGAGRMDEIASQEISSTPAQTLRVGMERVDELVNLTGELIIASSGFDQKMDIFLEAVNELELSRNRLKEIAREMELSYEVKALEQLGSALNLTVADGEKVLHQKEFADFDTLELDRYSELNLIIRSLNESSIDVGSIQTQLTNLCSDFDGHLNRQRVILSELQGKMMRIRMTPMTIITNKLRRTVREVAGNLNKNVRLIITGAGIELDKLIWEKITDPLMHMLRNAVDHGIEPPALRQTLGKPSVATLKLDASREGNHVVIRIADDGAGLNYKAIRASVRKMGLSERVDEMSEEELTPFIFYPGLSTSSKISQVSGRGVGMDVVKENIHHLKGSIQVTSEKGNGTQFSIRIPLTLAAVKALLFTVEGHEYAIALNEINKITRLTPDNFLGQQTDAVRIDDEILPFFRMSEMLNNPEKNNESISESEHPVTLVFEAGGRRGVVAIDTLKGQREIVIKSLGSHLQYVKGISGITIKGDGSLVPIMNLEEFFWRKTDNLDVLISDDGLMKAIPMEIMVIDDSVSIRKVVSRLMEDQGWKVQTAKDGIDALEKLRESKPDLIVLDIEMPRMNGYEFLGALKSQSAYQDIPVVMLTSRNAAKHRDKAKALGAKGFVVKPYNDDEFINLILLLTTESKKEIKLNSELSSTAGHLTASLI
jgi:chemosensory pili system protein ChpA (sensor histidine kinase/response regulator)